MIGQKGVPATYGGIERHVEELATRLVTAGHRVRVYCRPHYTPEDASLEGVELVRLPSIHTKHLDAITHVIVSTLHALFHRVDVVHFHALGPSSLSWLPRLFGMRTVVTVHGLDWRRQKWGRVASVLLHLCEWTATRLPGATIVVSKTLEKHFGQKGAKRVVHIPNGTPMPGPADPGLLSGLGLEANRYLLFVGRIVPEKGLHVLLRAHREHAVDWPLAIAGEGHFTDGYVERCRGEASDGVRFLGSVYGDELAALWQHAALVVVPSDLEGLSIALLEAMSFGRPVLGSDIPENVEVLEGVGETFAAGDAADLGAALKRLLATPSRLAEMGRLSRERIRREYDWERVVERTIEVYRSLAGPAPSGERRRVQESTGRSR